MNLSNVIADMISDMLEAEDQIEIQRNTLAQSIGCVPSQINYVLSSRFTPERGFIVESRRGGGGCIKITKVRYDKNTLLMDIISSVGVSINEKTLRHHISSLVTEEIISERDGLLILSAVNDNTLRCVPAEYRDTVRASIFKQMLVSII